MLYTIAEVSSLIHLSKVSIYKKLKLKEMKPYITKKQGITYIDETGFNLIRDSLKLNDEVKTELNNKDIDNSINDDIAMDIEDLNIKYEYTNYLKAENERLWHELQEKNLQLNNMQRLVENGQILLKDKPQDIKALEEHFNTLDNKLIAIRQQMDERKNQAEKGFFQKLFKK